MVHLCRVVYSLNRVSIIGGQDQTYTRSSKSTRKRNALELERQMRQQLVETPLLGHREHINIHEACDALLATSKHSGAYSTLVTTTNRFKDYFDDIYLDPITNRDLSRWVEYERRRGIKDITILSLAKC